MMKKICVLILAVLFTGLVYAERIANMPQLEKPRIIKIDKDRVFIVGGPVIYIYSLKDFTFIGKFGKAGEGPQEFTIPRGFNVQVTPMEDYLFIESPKKVSYFTRDGMFIKEAKVTVGRFFIPLGKKFIGRQPNTEDGINYSTINIYNEKMEKEKEVFRHKVADQPGSFKMFPPPFQHEVYRDKIYVAGRTGMVVDVFNADGGPSHQIKYDFDSLKITPEHQKIVKDMFKKDVRLNEAQRAQIISMLAFPEYFPAIFDFKIDGDMIYLRTYRQKDYVYEFYLFNLDGKFVKQTNVPIAMEMFVKTLPFTIHNGSVYQLIEKDDPDAEIPGWELHVTPIN